MRLINLKTNKYPLTVYDIRIENPQVSYPDILQTAPEGYAIVTPCDSFPSYDRLTQKIQDTAVKQSDGTWVQTLTVVNLDAATAAENVRLNREAAEQEVIRKRDQLLSRSDWTQLSDVILTNKEEWIAYRQQLRDITAQTGYPLNITWPVEPNK